jgi:GNAT superfamily N-acetyltransferase
VCVRGGVSRGVVLDPGAVSASAVAAACDGAGAVRVEDPFSVIDLAPFGFGPEFEMDVMARPAGAGAAPAACTDVAVERVADAEALAVAERVVVEGFPIPRRGRGTLLPPAILTLPGSTAWLARRDGRPAGALTAYDDGASLGMYLLATLPDHRRRGVGAALLAAAAAAAPSRPAVLTATGDGAPLYAACGYASAGRATWWWRG